MPTPVAETNHKPALVVAATVERRMADAWRVCFRAVKPLPWVARDRSRGRRSMHMALADMRIAIDGGAALEDALAPIRELEADVRQHYCERHPEHETECAGIHLRALSLAEQEAQSAAECTQLALMSSECALSLERAESAWRTYLARAQRLVTCMARRRRELARIA